MEALHKKVHAEAEKLVDAEFNHQRFVNEMKTDYERKVEQLQAELSHMRVGRSPRGSAEALVKTPATLVSCNFLFRSISLEYLATSYGT